MWLILLEYTCCGFSSTKFVACGKSLYIVKPRAKVGQSNNPAHDLQGLHRNTRAVFSKRYALVSCPRTINPRRRPIGCCRRHKTSYRMPATLLASRFTHEGGDLLKRPDQNRTTLPAYYSTRVGTTAGKPGNKISVCCNQDE